MRKLVVSMLEQSMNRANTNSDDIIHLQGQQRKLLTKIDEVEMIMLKQHKHGLTYDAMQREFKEFQNQKRSFENQMRSEHEGFRDTFALMRDKCDRVEKEAYLYNDKLLEY